MPLTKASQPKLPLQDRLALHASRLKEGAQAGPDQSAMPLSEGSVRLKPPRMWISCRPVYSRPAEKMLTLAAILAGPILVTTIVTIVVFEIKDAWDRNRLR
jgi:hypothetical protein